MSDTTGRVRELNLYRQYFDLVASGTKTIEVRVKYPHLADLAMRRQHPLPHQRFGRNLHGQRHARH